MSSPISPEFKLLCSLLPVHFRGELPWPSDWSGVDPAAFFNYVLKTQVAPLALHHWETRCPALWAATPFKTRARIVAWQELFHHKQLARFASWRDLLAAFAAADLPVIPLKGFVLSRHLYADPFRRHSSDFDLLIRRADFAAADALLRGLGCLRVKWHGPRAACEAGYARAGADPESAWNVDLHWDVVPRWHFLWRPFEGAWDQAVAWSWEAGAAPPGEPANRRAGEPADGESAERRNGKPANGQSVDLQKQKESSLRPLCLCGESANLQSAICQSANLPLLTLSPPDTAWFAVVNNVSDYGLGNLRGCVEALELLALLDEAEADRFRAMARAARAGRALAALERFRARFFPGSAADTVTRLAPARRRAAARHFDDERLYLTWGANGHAAGASNNGSASHRAPLSQRAAIRLALAGPGPRFARFCAGKLYETVVIRANRLKD